jgi:sigma-B regulation protein RsbU (phosphoserine phosphatase)
VCVVEILNHRNDGTPFWNRLSITPVRNAAGEVTLVYGTLEPSSGTFRYVTAGHPSPVLLPAGGDPVAVPGAGLPIGMIDGAAYDEETLVLQPGDRMYLYTDGAIEALDGNEEEFGIDRLVSEFTRWRDLPLQQGLQHAVAAVRGWCEGRLRDDIPLLAVERLA